MPELFKCPTTELPRFDNVREQSSKSLETKEASKLNATLLTSRFRFFIKALALLSNSVHKLSIVSSTILYYTPLSEARRRLERTFRKSKRQSVGGAVA